jgi:soluble lytic murein transglycosylase-like protein
MKQMVLVLLLCLSHAGAQGLRETASAWVDHYARAYGVPAEFVRAVIDVESGWQTNVISTKGALASCNSRRQQPSRSE